VPAHPFETTLVRPARSGKQPYLTFDRNQYFLPHTLVQRPVTLLADGAERRDRRLPAGAAAAQARAPAGVPLVLPNHPGVQDLEVAAHALESYDALSPDRARDPE
jgi:hypothetical protein